MQDYEAVKALNSIDIVFSDSDAVLSAWHRYRKALIVDGEITSEKLKEMGESETKLYECMAKSLNYRKITWDIIDKPHCPKWLAERHESFRNQDVIIKNIAQYSNGTQNMGRKKK